MGANDRIDGRALANLVERYNKAYLGNALSMLPLGTLFPLDYNFLEDYFGPNPHTIHARERFGVTPKIPRPEGIDLRDEEVAIEMKSRWASYELRFDITNNQVKKYEKNYQIPKYWAFFFYDFKIHRSNVTKNNLGESIDTREICLMPWKLIKQFEIKPSGHIYVLEKDLDISRDTHTCYKMIQGHLWIPTGESLLEEKAKSSKIFLWIDEKAEWDVKSLHEKYHPKRMSKAEIEKLIEADYKKEGDDFFINERKAKSHKEEQEE